MLLGIPLHDAGDPGPSALGERVICAARPCATGYGSQLRYETARFWLVLTATEAGVFQVMASIVLTSALVLCVTPATRRQPLLPEAVNSDERGVSLFA